MPIGPFKDFKDCEQAQISKGKSPDVASKICGFLEQKFKKGNINDSESELLTEAINSVESGAKYPDIDACVKDQTSKGKSADGAKKYCGFLEKLHQVGGVTSEDPMPTKSDPVTTDMESCMKEKIDAGMSPQDAHDACASMGKKSAAESPTPKDEMKIDGMSMSPDDFADVPECVKHVMDKHGKDEKAASTFCDKLMNPKTAQVKSIDRNETIQRYSQTNQAEDKLFVKAFLLDDSVNLNHWGVDPASIERNINTFIGKPMVLTEKFDHPVVDDMSYGHALQYQDIYRIGTIIDIIKMSDKQKISPYGNSYYAIIEITNDAAKKAFQTGDLPLYVSPAIAQMELGEDPEKLQAWLALHLAVVDDPAYTVKKAMITGQCSGDQATCLVRLRQAHIQKHGYGSCGFCIYGKLTSVKKVEVADEMYATLKNVKTASHVSVTESGVTTSGTEGVPTVTVTVPIATSTADNTEKITVPVELNNTSLESQNEHVQQVHSMENTNTNVADVPNKTAPTTETTQPAAVAPQTPAPAATAPEVVSETTQNMIDLTKSGEGSDAILKAQYIQYKAEATILKEQKASLERKLADTQAELTTLKESLRKSQIASVVTEDLIADEKTREETIKFFMDAGLTQDQVKAVYENVGITKTASVNTGVQTPSYEPRMPLIRTAKKNDSEHDVEAILGLADMIVKNDGGAV